jgi:uncharacterized membrane protein HdeD (DUF308 family)
MIRKILVVVLIIMGCFNEFSGMVAMATAPTAIQEIGGICMLILGTLQYILAYLLWPKQ